MSSSARPVDELLIDFPRHIQALRKHFQPAADSKNAVEEIGDAVQPQIYSATKDVRVSTPPPAALAWSASR